MLSKKPTSFHENFNRKEIVSISSEKSFGLTFAIFFLVLAFFFLKKEQSIYLLFLIFSALLFFITFTIPKFLKYPNIFWNKLGLLLQKVFSPLILIGLFYGVFTPLGLILRLFKKDLLFLRLDSSAQSYWLDAPQTTTSMKDQF